MVQLSWKKMINIGIKPNSVEVTRSFDEAAK